MNPQTHSVMDSSGSAVMNLRRSDSTSMRKEPIPVINCVPPQDEGTKWEEPSFILPRLGAIPGCLVCNFVRVEAMGRSIRFC